MNSGGFAGAGQERGQPGTLFQPEVRAQHTGEVCRFSREAARLSGLFAAE